MLAKRDRAGAIQAREKPSRDHDDVVFSKVRGGSPSSWLSQLTRQQLADLVNCEWNGERLVGAGYRKVVDRETGEVRAAKASSARR